MKNRQEKSCEFWLVQQITVTQAMCLWSGITMEQTRETLIKIINRIFVHSFSVGVPYYMTQCHSLLTLISYYAIVFSFALRFKDSWFTH